MKILVTGGSGFIGTNAVEAFSQRGWNIFNYSTQAPLKSEHTGFWKAGDILDLGSLQETFRDFQPDLVLHLAARTDCDEKTTVAVGYRVNTEGTRNVLDAIRVTPSIQRVIITSSQFVCAPGRLPKNDTDYFPETVFVNSTAATEKLT